MKHLLIGLAAGVGIVAVGYIGLIGYATYAISKCYNDNPKEIDNG